MLIGFEHVGMAVSDLDRTIAFYCDLLGLRLILRKSAQDGRTELAFLDAGNCQLEIVCPSPQIERASHAHALPPSRAEVRHLTFAFDDMDAMFETLVNAGVTVLEPPREAYNQEILKRVAFVEDPDGIVIELAQKA